MLCGRGYTALQCTRRFLQGHLHAVLQLPVQFIPLGTCVFEGEGANRLGFLEIRQLHELASDLDAIRQLYDHDYISMHAYAHAVHLQSQCSL
jgi:hypothetical protein